jgi:glucan biosynthesis protein
VNRRHFLAASALPLLSLAAPGLVASARAQPAPFDRSVVRQMARDLVGKSFKAPDNKLPDNLKDLDYDRYRALRFCRNARSGAAKSYLSRRNSFIVDFSIPIESTSMR